MNEQDLHQLVEHLKQALGERLDAVVLFGSRARGEVRWRACVVHAQLVVENALKAVIALFAPVPRTHAPADVLSVMLEEGDVPPAMRADVQELVNIAQGLDLATIHIQTDYGDEAHDLTPWERFSEEDAREALTLARRVVEEAVRLIQEQGGADEA